MFTHLRDGSDLPVASSHSGRTPQRLQQEEFLVSCCFLFPGHRSAEVTEVASNTTVTPEVVNPTAGCLKQLSFL